MKTLKQKDIESFVRRLVAGFTQHPELIGIETETVGNCISVKFRPTAEDTGALIGTAGKMHKSFQAVLSAFVAQSGFRIHMAPIVEPSDKSKLPVKESNLTKDQIGLLFSTTCEELFEKPFGWDWDSNARRLNINLMISKNEARNVTDAELGEGLSRIFNAIGHKNGMNIYVMLERSKT